MAIRVKHQRFIPRFIFAAATLLFSSGASVANVVVDWNAIAMDAPAPAGGSPPLARNLGYVHARSMTQSMASTVVTRPIW
jgi:hypothetical protein